MNDKQIPRRLPLWKSWVEENAKTFQFGQFFPNEILEQALSCKWDSLEFAFAFVAIRKALRLQGMNITARGQGQLGYVINAPETNGCEMQRLQKQAIRAMREGVILGTNTPLDSLTADDKRRHESILEKMATRLALINRRNPVLLAEVKQLETTKEAKAS